jgi:FkbM family methyltransferase
MKFDLLSLNKWKSDNGDETHIFNYNINENSIIIDLGGYHGVWVEKFLEKIHPISPKVILVEPVTQFYDHLITKFKNYKNVIIMNCGVSTDGKESTKDLFFSSDGSSTNFKEGRSIKIDTLPIDKILSNNNLEFVDLIQINIEGDEYSLMEYMVESGIINKFKNIQIQYHLGIEGDRDRRDKIQKKMLNNDFKKNYDYPFVWESWTKY